jgi:hypothetical protein
MASNFGVVSEACLVLGLIAATLNATDAVSRVGFVSTIWLMLHGGPAQLSPQVNSKQFQERREQQWPSVKESSSMHVSMSQQ